MREKKEVKCPYCNRKLSYAEVWNLHKHAEYKCDNCNYFSAVIQSKKIKNNAIKATVFSVFLIVLLSVISKINLWEIFLVIIPFLLFYITLPRYINLNKKKQQRDKSYYDKQQNEIKYYSDNMGETSVIKELNNKPDKSLQKPEDDINQTRKI